MPRVAAFAARVALIAAGSCAAQTLSMGSKALHRVVNASEMGVLSFINTTTVFLRQSTSRWPNWRSKPCSRRTRVPPMAASAGHARKAGGRACRGLVAFLADSRPGGNVTRHLT